MHTKSQWENSIVGNNLGNRGVQGEISFKQSCKVQDEMKRTAFQSLETRSAGVVIYKHTMKSLFS